MFHVEHLPNTNSAAIWASGAKRSRACPDRRRSAKSRAPTARFTDAAASPQRNLIRTERSPAYFRTALAAARRLRPISPLHQQFH